MTYRTELDGLRALAVVSVILHHAGFDWLSGGFVGVDVFFVISGYLITTIIVEEIEGSRFSLTRFYERRARRLLPALVVVMIACIPFAWMWMLPEALENFGQSLIATTFFSNNVLLSITTGYWAFESDFKPLLHTWSLGIEEQYYLFFPLLLVGVWRYGKIYVVIILSALSMTSFALSEIIAHNFPNANFYLIVTRAWELFAGSLAALMHKRREIKPSNFLSLLGLSAIVTAIVTYDEFTPSPSAYVLLPVLGTVLIVLFTDSQTLAARILCYPLMVGIGLISYSIYLWHQPLLSFAKIYSKSEPNLMLNTSLIVVTFIIAYLTWRFVETPFRNSHIVPAGRFATLAIGSAIAITAFGYGAHSSHGFIGRQYSDSSKYELKHNIYNMRNFTFKTDNFNVSNFGTKLLIIGDSYGRDVVNIVRETYDTAQLNLLYRDDLTYCTALDSTLGRRLFAETDIILFSLSYLIDKSCIDKVIHEANVLNKKLFFIGTKQFGYNLNWIARVPGEERALLRNEILERAKQARSSARQHIPPEYLISIMDVLVDDRDTILITDEFGKLISGDRAHVTKYGAQFIGRRVFLPSPLTDVLHSIGVMVR